MKKLIFLIAVILGAFTPGYGQELPYIQITGTILDKETLEPLPFATAIVKGSYHGTMTSATGLFTILAKPSDTLQFSFVGYAPSELIIPEGLRGGRYALLELLEKETIVLRELQIYPWPSPDQFYTAFMGVNLPASESEKTRMLQKELAETIRSTYASEKYYDEQWKNRQIYELTGQIPANHFFDPVRWQEFIDGIKKKKGK